MNITVERSDNPESHHCFMTLGSGRADGTYR